MRIEQESALKEREEMLEQMREHRKLESEKINRIRMENKKYQSDLEEQISYQRKLKEKEIADARKELEMLNVSKNLFRAVLEQLKCHSIQKTIIVLIYIFVPRYFVTHWKKANFFSLALEKTELCFFLYNKENTFKNLCSFFTEEVQLPRGCRATGRKLFLLTTMNSHKVPINSWYSLDRP